MVEEGNREFTDMEVPVGMSGPLRIERLTVIEWHPNLRRTISSTMARL